MSDTCDDCKVRYGVSEIAQQPKREIERIYSLPETGGKTSIGEQVFRRKAEGWLHDSLAWTE